VGEQKFTENFEGKPEGDRDHLEKLGVDDRIILIMILLK
jgi:hypothetical protein